MRVLLLIMAAASAVAAQRVTGVTHPVPGDLLNFDVPLAVSGRVLLDDRQPPPEPVLVEYSCRGASLARSSLFIAPIKLDGCRVHVLVAGCEETFVTLTQPQHLSDLGLGDIALKASGPKGGAGFSVSGMNAPAKARANYTRAFETINEGKYPEALAALDKAIAAYPKYASALQLKGVVLERMGQREGAREAYRQAVEADPAYVKPLVELAQMAAEDRNPADAARWAATANELVPGAYPALYLIEASACFDLKRYADAEKAAQKGIDADPKFAYPGLRKLMGEVLFQKRSYAAALELFVWYLKEALDAPDIVSVQDRVQTCNRYAAKLAAK